ncbi:MAG TPA: TrkA C-terminal domain-containing protein [Actinomycetes bacterium]
MSAIITLFIAVLLSVLVARVGTIALVLTGLSHEAAKFQAHSAFLGVGFTTSEAETVVGHPVRRRILLLLMLLGNAGLVGVVVTVLLAFLNVGGGQVVLRAAALLAALLLVWLLVRSPWVNRRMGALIGHALRRWTHLDARDYADLLNLSEDWSVDELRVRSGEWLCGRTLAELDLEHEGVLVLGIYRADGSFVGTPTGHTPVRDGDTLVAYGRGELIAELDRRAAGPAGDHAHQESVAFERRLVAAQTERDEGR